MHTYKSKEDAPAHKRHWREREGRSTFLFSFENSNDANQKVRTHVQGPTGTSIFAIKGVKFRLKAGVSSQDIHRKVLVTGSTLQLVSFLKPGSPRAVLWQVLRTWR